jgi:N-methylhydantoinase A
LTGVAPTPTIRKVSIKQGRSLDAAPLKKAPTFFQRSGRLERMETAFYRRESLPVGGRVEGPAIVLQTDSTTVVPPGWTIVADGSGNLIMKARGAA